MVGTLADVKKAFNTRDAKRYILSGPQLPRVALDMVTSLIVGALASTAAVGASAAAKASVTTGLVGLSCGLGKGAFSAGFPAPFLHTCGHFLPAYGGSHGTIVSLSASASGPGASASAFANVPASAYANVPAWGFGYWPYYGWHAPSCRPSNWGPWTGGFW